MNRLTIQQAIEVFHLLFLDMLGRKVDKRFYALKGGCNLRFYLKSIRYSEDIDLDVQTLPKEKLQDAVKGILESEPFRQILAVQGLSIIRWSAPKQTDTTQRWKLGLESSNSSVPLPTKIEFSRMGMTEGVQFESVDPVLIGGYGLSPIMVNHYSAVEAYRQKVAALITRSTTQARDIFDIDLLIRSGVSLELRGTKLREGLDEAISNAMSVTFDMFKAKVLSYLNEDHQSQYDSEAIWDEMVLRVVEALNPEARDET